MIRDIDWPHLYVYRGTDRRPAQYNELTLAEFVHGYLSMIDNPRNNLSREVMLNILMDMTLDAALYGWPQIRIFYRILASSIEMARFDWGDANQTAALRLQYAQKPVIAPQSRTAPRFGANPNSVKLCIPYQKGQCESQDGHDNFIHACSFCFANTGMLFKHQEKDCRRIFFASKNGQRGEQYSPHSSIRDNGLRDSVHREHNDTIGKAEGIGQDEIELENTCDVSDILVLNSSQLMLGDDEIEIKCNAPLEQVGIITKSNNEMRVPDTFQSES